MVICTSRRATLDASCYGATIAYLRRRRINRSGDGAVLAGKSARSAPRQINVLEQV
jgi:hypothetical protein